MTTMPSASTSIRWLVPFLALAAAGPAPAATRSADKVMGEIKPDQALCYFVREAHFQGSARTMFLYAGDAFLGVLENNTYTFAYLEPGKHLLWLNWARINKEVELAAGKAYYFTVWTNFDDIGEELGKTLIAEAKFHTTPEAKEVATSAEHIANRRGKAEAFAEKGTTTEYVGTQSKREEHIAKWRLADLAQHSVLYIEDFVMADPKAGERTKTTRVAVVPRYLPDQVRDILGEGVFEQVRREAPAGPSAGAVILRGRITQYKPGSDTARLMVAGAGSAKLDFEATLIDGESGAELARVAGERTWAWGGAAGASRGIGDLEKNVAYELALYLKRCKLGASAQLEEPAAESEPTGEEPKPNPDA